ncbi:hypothetical protein F4801DRAFT_580973 [Xylaria longipes]|nr:hypothetical protein F4801DRAFT_580973 [Xylaria longipes]RYC57423.1 hypothetical protein CHU98_g8786 [Xylaria longipes]
MARTRPGKRHRSSAIAKPSESDLDNISTKYPHTDSELRRVQKNSEVPLPRPFSRSKRHKIAKKTRKLIERRNRLDREVLCEVEEKNPEIQDRLLRNREVLRRRERKHLRKRTKRVAKLEALWRQDSSSKRYNDYDLVRRLLEQFKRSLGPFLDEYTKHCSGWDSDGDEEPRRGIVAAKSPPHPKTKSPNEPNIYLRNKGTIKDTTKGASLSTQATRGKREREEETAESTPSKKGVALDHDVNYEGLSSENTPIFSSNRTTLGRGVLDAGNVPTVNCSFDRWTEARRRLDEIIEDSFKNLDALVYDTPNPPLGLRKKTHVDSGNPYYMFGALLTESSPSQVKGSSSATKSTGDMKMDSMDRRPLSSSPPELMPSSDPVSKPVCHCSLKTTNNITEKHEEGNAGLNQSGSGNKQIRAGQNQSQSTPSPLGCHSRGISIPSSSSSLNSSGKNNREDGEPVQNGARPSSRQIRLSSSRRETPIPAPQPWTRLGIPNPFDDHLPQTPTNRDQPRCLEAASTSQTEEKALGLSKPQEYGCNVSVKGFSGPDSSPLQGFPRSRANRDKKHRRKEEKKKKKHKVARQLA